MTRPDFDHWPFVCRLTARSVFTIGLAVWITASVGGFWCLLDFSATSGTASVLTTSWPVESQIVRDPARANLVLFLHPHCPCSRASLAELSEIMTHCDGQLLAQVLFLKPSQMPDGWEMTNLWHRATAIPGVRVWSDRDGAESRRFGAETSGQVSLYDRDGRLQFRGGITMARGHEGDNAGRRLIVERVTRGTDRPAENVIFGCSLFDKPNANAAITKMVPPVDCCRDVELHAIESNPADAAELQRPTQPVEPLRKPIEATP